MRGGMAAKGGSNACGRGRLSGRQQGSCNRSTLQRVPPALDRLSGHNVAKCKTHREEIQGKGSGLEQLCCVVLRALAAASSSRADGVTRTPHAGPCHSTLPRTACECARPSAGCETGRRTASFVALGTAPCHFKPCSCLNHPSATPDGIASSGVQYPIQGNLNPPCPVAQRRHAFPPSQASVAMSFPCSCGTTRVHGSPACISCRIIGRSPYCFN